MINYGFIASKMDGTEIKYTPKINIVDNMPKEISYREYLPSVINQGSKPICVPCSISSYVNWSLNLRHGDNKKDNKLNYDDVFAHRTNDSNEGMSFKDAFSYLRHNKALLEIGKVKVLDRYAMVGSEIVLKHALVANGPCVGGLKVYDTNRVDFWEPREYDKFQGGHAVSIVGYNKDGFIIRNSWGKSYGDGGYAVLPYDSFTNFTEVWTIID